MSTGNGPAGRWRWRTAAAAAVAMPAAWWVRTVVVPRRPADAALPIPRRAPVGDAHPLPDGAGLRIVVNPSSGPAWSGSPAQELRDELPGAEVIELGEGDDLPSILRSGGASAVGAAGGDGTLAAAAAVAVELDVPLVVVPAGTLNHLARDLGISGVDDVASAVRAGTVALLDLGQADGRVFVNTLTFGGYATVVDARERLEPRLGKWPALLVALIRELPRMAPLHVELDGEPMRVWLAWVGNGRYSPPGFGPAWRERLDDGLLDVRIVHGARRFSRSRFALHVLTGRLGSCPVYEERTAASLAIRSLEGPLRGAADGETFDVPAVLDVTKRRRALRVAVPPYDEDREREPGERSDRPTTTESPTSTRTPMAVSQGPARS